MSNRTFKLTFDNSILEKKGLTSILKIGIFLITIMLFTSSCVSKKKILYLQDVENIKNNPENANYNLTLRANDLLSINVSALNPETVAPFNLPTGSGTGSLQTSSPSQSYLINKEGTIEFPVIGTVKLGGLTRNEAIEVLKEKITKYVKDPIVNLQILNFNITVLGEVSSPGTHTINDERITILEALGRSGDMTIFGNRKNVKVIRDVEGNKSYAELDFTSVSIIDSPFYYLQQNDVVIVSPNNAQIQGSAFNRNTSVLISLAGIIISVIGVLTR